jgi:hypothetical protein
MPICAVDAVAVDRLRKNATPTDVRDAVEIDVAFVESARVSD